MSNGWSFYLVNDEQMSNKVGVKHLPVSQFNQPINQPMNQPSEQKNQPIDQEIDRNIVISRQKMS